LVALFLAFRPFGVHTARDACIPLNGHICVFAGVFGGYERLDLEERLSRVSVVYSPGSLNEDMGVDSMNKRPVKCRSGRVVCVCVCERTRGEQGCQYATSTTKTTPPLPVSGMWSHTKRSCTVVFRSSAP
jgi:hypothetical protein